MGRLSELDEIERKGFVPEKRETDREPWEVAWDEWWARNKHVFSERERDFGSLLMERLYHDGFEDGVAHARAELRNAVNEALPVEDPQGGEVWRCRGCGSEIPAAELLKNLDGYHHERVDPDFVQALCVGRPVYDCGPVVRGEPAPEPDWWCCSADYPEHTWDCPNKAFSPCLMPCPSCPDDNRCLLGRCAVCDAPVGPGGVTYGSRYAHRECVEKENS